MLNSWLEYGRKSLVRIEPHSFSPSLTNWWAQVSLTITADDQILGQVLREVQKIRSFRISNSRVNQLVNSTWPKQRVQNALQQEKPISPLTPQTGDSKKLPFQI